MVVDGHVSVKYNMLIKYPYIEFQTSTFYKRIHSLLSDYTNKVDNMPSVDVYLYQN